MVPTPSLPTGGDALRGIGERFTMGAFTGTASLTVPLGLTPNPPARRILPARVPPTPPGRSARDRKIVALIDEGLSNKEIAGRLRIEFATVENHIHNLLRKLEAGRRAEAAALLRRADRGRVIELDARWV